MNPLKLGSAVLISGSTSGLGLNLASDLTKKGKSVVLCGRNLDALHKITEKLSESKNNDQVVLGLACDVSDENSVSKMFEMVHDNGLHIETLVCNAGLIGPISKFLECNRNEWRQAFNVNFYGTLNLINEVLPDMIKRKFGRIIHISGGGASSPLYGMSSYAASKIASVRFIETLSLEYSGSGITFNSVAPGMLKTKLLDQMLKAGPDRIGTALFDKASQKIASDVDATKKVLDLISFLMSDRADLISGKIISAEWDNWAEWPNHVEELNGSDIYTLRRITGRERHSTWGDIH